MVSRFVYRGNAVGAAGTFFPVQAASSLPVIGGKSRSGVTFYRSPGDETTPPGIVSFEAVTTKAMGRESGGGFETRVEARIQGVEVLREQELLSADLMGSAIASMHELEGDKDSPIYFPVDKNQILGMRILGKRVEVKFNEKLMELATMGSVRSVTQAFKSGSSCSSDGFPYEKNRFFHQSEDHFFYSLVEGFEWADGSLPRGVSLLQRNVLLVKTDAVEAVLSFGEVIREAGAVRMSLFRGRLHVAGLFGKTNAPALPAGALAAVPALPQQKEDVVFCEVESNGLSGPEPDNR